MAVRAVLTVVAKTAEVTGAAGVVVVMAAPEEDVTVMVAAVGTCLGLQAMVAGTLGATMAEEAMGEEKAAPRVAGLEAMGVVHKVVEVVEVMALAMAAEREAEGMVAEGTVAYRAAGRVGNEEVEAGRE